MGEFVSFFRAFEGWIYLLLGLGALIFIRKFLLAWHELRGAVFGLERENAQARLNQAASILVIVLTMAVAEFVLVYFYYPTVAGVSMLPTPTLDLLATPTTTLPATNLQPAEAAPTLAIAEFEPSAESVCLPGQVEITFPSNGVELRGVVQIQGSANLPNFGFYKFEIKRPDETVWLTIQAGNVPVTNEKLGDWDTSRLTPGEYDLALVVVDNQANASTPCIVRVRVASAPDSTPNP